MFVAKYNTSGSLQWQRRLQPITNSFGWSIGIDSVDNHPVIVGSVYGTFGYINNNAAYTLKLNSDGSGVLWSKVLDGDGYDTFADISSKSDYLYTIGDTNSSGGLGGYDMLLAKYQANTGNLIWQNSLGLVAGGVDRAFSIVNDPTGSIYFTGQTTSPEGNADILIGKLPQDGTGQGTYGSSQSFTYKTRSLIHQDMGYTINVMSLPDTAGTLVDQASTSLSILPAYFTETIVV